MRVGKNNTDRKVFALKDFRGVDYASSPLEVQPYRATDMANLLLRDGQLQKRYGFKQLGQATSKTIKKAFSLSDMDIEDSAQKILFQIEDTEENADGTKSDITLFQCYTIDKDVSEVGEPTKISGHYPAASGIAIGGDYYLFVPTYGIMKVLKSADDTESTEGTLKIERLGARDMYAPITTINIPLSAYGSDMNPIGDPDLQYPYVSNESINMLTSYRVNEIKVKKSLDTFEDVQTPNGLKPYLFFQLDGTPSNSTGPAIGLDWTPIVSIYKKDGADIIWSDIGTFVWENGVWVNSSLGVSIYTSANEAPGYPSTASSSRGMLKIDNTDTFKSWISAGIEDESGYVSLRVKFFDTNAYAQQGTTYDGMFSQDALKIFGATCLTTFGVDGANDRIFVGGSADTPNIVYFSENDISLKANPTYFPADQFLVCGSTKAPVTGFLRVTDGTMAILKRTTDLADTTVYYTSGYYNELTDEIGNTYYEARFTVKSGDIARRGVSAGAITNFEGDNIFVSETGVYGIQLSNNVASGERYSKERSRTINPKITAFDLSKSKGIVYDEKYFLAVGNGEVYVADARYKYMQNGDQENTFNYEWFRLTGLFVKEWFSIGNKLYFMDNDNYICEFTEGFADQYLVSTKNHELMVGNDGRVTFNSERLPLIKASSYAVDDKGRKWQLQLTEDEKSIFVPDELLADEENPIYGGMDLALWFCVPVAAYWQSAVMNLNSPMYLKNMWSLSMVASAKHGGKINLGYKTRMSAVNNVEVEGANDTDWGDISLFGGSQTSLITGDKTSFGMYTFDVGGYVGINTYRRRLFERNFAHIQLLFMSETTTDCAVSEVDIEYSIARKNIGVG